MSDDDLDISSIGTLQVFGEWGVASPWWPRGAHDRGGDDWLGPLDISGVDQLGLNAPLVADGIAWRDAREAAALRSKKAEVEGAFETGPGKEDLAALATEGEAIARRTSRELPDVVVEGPSGHIYREGRRVS